MEAKMKEHLASLRADLQQSLDCEALALKHRQTLWGDVDLTQAYTDVDRCIWLLVLSFERAHYLAAFERGRLRDQAFRRLEGFMADLTAAAAETPTEKLGQLYDQVRPTAMAQLVHGPPRIACGLITIMRSVVAIAAPRLTHTHLRQPWQYFEEKIIRVIKEHESRCDSGFEVDDAYEVGLAFLAAMEEVSHYIHSKNFNKQRRTSIQFGAPDSFASLEKVFAHGSHSALPPTASVPSAH
jgi:hypothetical protein